MKRKEAGNDRQMDLDEFLVACHMLATRLEVTLPQGLWSRYGVLG